MFVNARNVVLIIGLCTGLSGCVTSTKDENPNATYSAAAGEKLSQVPLALPTWKEPFYGLKPMTDAVPAQCLLVVDSSANKNAWMTQRNSFSPQGVFDHLNDKEAQVLNDKGWAIIPFENSLYAPKQIKEWAAATVLAYTPASYETLTAEDQAAYMKNVVDKSYGKLKRVQVIRLLSRPSDLHQAFFGNERAWATNDQGLFVSHDKGNESIYRVGLVDFKRDARKQWPVASATNDSIKYERRSQLRDPDWQRLAQVTPGTRTPSDAGSRESDRIELGVHLSLVENFIYFLPECAPR